MKNLTIIATVSENNVIGIKNKIPWRIKEDMVRFKELTLNHPVIMGRKTYESIPEKFRPLSQRKNIVLSKTLEQKEGIYIARGLIEALKLADNQDIYVAGGREIYRIFLPLANKMEITRIHKNYEGNVFFPEVDWRIWELINEENRVSENGICFSFLSYKNILAPKNPNP